MSKQLKTQIATKKHHDVRENNVTCCNKSYWSASCLNVIFLYLSDYKISVDQTPLPSYMNRLLEILVEEEQDSEADGVNGAVGPCMEYMLQHRVLDTLYTFARTDVRLYLLTHSLLTYSSVRQ